ncbi:hypothetical protein GCM10010206_60870 [Streptomyces cinerochromogenes]|nr:hypothetical protein GCM10010206_60870 [Streptomyces cinerochromogenes]
MWRPGGDRRPVHATPGGQGIKPNGWGFPWEFPAFRGTAGKAPETLVEPPGPSGSRGGRRVHGWGADTDQ